MATTSWKYTGTAANVDRDGKVAWTNPTYAQADDTNYAESTDKGGDYTDWLRCTNFGFTTSDIPSGSSIDGIEMAFGRNGGGFGVGWPQDHAIYLRISSGQTGDNKANLGVNWPETPITEDTKGGAADDWNWAGDDDDVRSSSFGVDISAWFEGGSIPGYGYIDYVKIRVHYTPTTQIKTVNDLAKASVKTIDDLAIASVASFNDLV